MYKLVLINQHFFLVQSNNHKRLKINNIDYTFKYLWYLPKIGVIEFLPYWIESWFCLELYNACKAAFPISLVDKEVRKVEVITLHIWAKSWNKAQYPDFTIAK